MPGMKPGLDAANPALVAAFRSALLRQFGVIAVIFVLLLLAYAVARSRGIVAAPSRGSAEPRGRRLVRVGFGLLWILDGVLQAQPRMAGGLPSQVIGPVAGASPRWVQQVVNAGGTVWSYHPVQAAAAAVWIQVGLGLWLILAPAGWWSRLAGLTSVAWGLVVWTFGEAFGGIFAPGLTWLSGAPGAVLLYVVAGGLIALPPAAWAGPRAGRLLLAGTGLCWAGFAVLQAWPGRGSWSGAVGGMASSMAQIPQPHAQAAMVSAFASFAAGHAFAVNLFVVVALGAFGIAFLTGRGLRAAVPAAVVFCAADWALVQDFGVPGGLGTDPNSMVPWMVLLAGGYLAMTQPASLPAAAGVSAGRLPALRQAVASATARSVTGLGAFAVVLVGAAPMAAATADRTADPIIARALAGPPVPLDRPAPRFRLLDVSGQPVTLMSLRGRVLLLTFLDPVCADCPVIAQEMKAAGARLGPAAGRVSLVAISADSTRSGPAFLRAFDRQQGLTSVPNWLFLTGSVAQLQPVWDAYEKIAPRLIIGMTARADLIFVIDRSGQIRLEIPDSPAPATASARSSFAGLLADSARQALTGP